MGVNCRHCGVDYLEMNVRKPATQQSLQHPCQTKFGVRIAISGRFAKNNYSDRAWRFLLWNCGRKWFSCQFTPEKSPGDTVILNQYRLAVDLRGQKESGWIAEFSKS